MMRFENPLQTLRALKGCPLSVLLALSIGQKMNLVIGQEWIERNTGYTDKPVSQALVLLQEYGLVTKSTGKGWVLTNGALQLPLMNELLPDEMSRNISDSSSSRVYLDSRIQNQDSSTTKSEKFRLCDEHGIRDPKRSEIAADPEITVAMFLYHCRTADSIGQAIYRMLHHWAIKETGEPVQQDLEESQVAGEEGPPAEYARVWDLAIEAVKGEFSLGDYTNWLRATHLLKVDVVDEARVWVGGISNRFGLEWLNSHQVAEVLAEHLGGCVRFEVG